MVRRRRRRRPRLRLIGRPLRRRDLPLLRRWLDGPTLRRVVRWWWRRRIIAPVGLGRLVVLVVLRCRRVLQLRLVLRLRLVRPHRLLVIRLLIRSILLHVLRRRQGSPGRLHTRRNGLRSLLMFIGIVRSWVRVRLRIYWPLDSLHRSDWICTRRAPRVRRIRPLVLITLRCGELISSRTIRNRMRRRCDNRASRQWPYLWFLSHWRSNGNCARPGRNLFALLID